MDLGLGGTYRGSGKHDGRPYDFYKNLSMVQIDMTELMTGTKQAEFQANPFIRWHHSYKNYPGNLGYIDDYSMHTHDQFERFKKYDAKDEHTVGWTPNNPLGEDEEEYRMYDVQGEGPFTNPPDINTPVIDHGQDEEYIWNFPKNAFNQQVVQNLYTPNNPEPHRASYAPYWGQKLSMPHFYKREKMEKFYRHWQHRLGLEDLKKGIVHDFGINPTVTEKKEIEGKVSAYIDDCYTYEAERKFDDVFVTDHVPVDPKYTTNG